MTSENNDLETLYLVIPAYNEENNIENVVRQWMLILDGKNEKSQMVIADSGSSDSTHKILLSLKKEFSQLEILDDTEKQHGPKLMALYMYAIKQGADYIFQTDSDGQTNPEEFEAFWNKRNDADAVIGYRPVREDGTSRAFVEKVVCILLRLYFGVKVPDANAPFRLMKTELVGKYIDRLPSDYNIPNIMLTTYFAFYDEKVSFLPISFKPRQAGENSINIKKIVAIGIKAVKEFSGFKKEMK